MANNTKRFMKFIGAACKLAQHVPAGILAEGARQLEEASKPEPEPKTEPKAKG